MKKAETTDRTDNNIINAVETITGISSFNFDSNCFFLLFEIF
ncbi:MAG: hypothetical protein ACTSPQ_01490 [Candidatus Helarchaeota archaeon]